MTIYLAGAFRQIRVIPTVRPAVFSITRRAKLALSGVLRFLLCCCHPRLPPPLPSPLTICRGGALRVTLHISQDTDHFELYRVLRDCVRRLVLWLWCIIFLFCSDVSCCKLLNYSKHTCITGYHTLSQLRSKYVRVVVPYLLHRGSMDLLKLYLRIFKT